MKEKASNQIKYDLNITRVEYSEKSRTNTAICNVLLDRMKFFRKGFLRLIKLNPSKTKSLYLIINLRTSGKKKPPYGLLLLVSREP